MQHLIQATTGIQKDATDVKGIRLDNTPFSCHVLSKLNDLFVEPERMERSPCVIFIFICYLVLYVCDNFS